MEGAFGLRTVSFNSNGGSQIPEQKLLRGEPAVRPVNPVRANFIFDDWYADTSFTNKWDFSEIPEGDLVLNARWISIGMALHPAGDIVFGPVSAGYDPVTPQSITIVNIGDLPTGELSISLSGVNSNSFNTSVTTMSSIIPGSSDNFTVSPVTGLSSGSYSAVVIVSNGTGISLSKNVIFTVEQGAVTGIALVSPPDNLSYTHGDTLDLSGLVVRINYAGGEYVNVPLAEFNQIGIATNPADGTVLSHTDHDAMDFAITRVPHSISPFSLTVSQRVITNLTFPTAQTIVYPNPLSSSVLTGGSTEYGLFAWAAPATVPIVANTGYNVVFTPNDTVNYNWSGISMTQNVTITVNPAPITYAPVTVTGPNVGIAPDVNASTISEYFTVSSDVTWTPNVTVFAGSTRYTATVTLNAEPNRTFTGETTASINGYAATITNNTGSSITISHEFGPTGTKTITGLTILDYPTLTYNHGDALDLSELKVRVTYIDSTYDDVDFDDFDLFTIGTDIEDGTILLIPDHHNEDLTVGVGSYNEPVGTLIINPKQLTVASAEHTKQFDDTTTATGVTVTLNGILNVDENNITIGTVTAAYSAAATGTTEISISNIVLTGSAAGYYTVLLPASVNVTGGGITRADGAAIDLFIYANNPQDRTISVGTATLASATGQSIEYNINTTNEAPATGWVDSGHFTDITIGTTNYVFARSAQNENYNAGTPDVSSAITFYQVSYDKNDSSAVTTVNVLGGTVVTAPTPEPERDGFEFKGWFRDAGFNTEWNFAADTVTENITLYAKWLAEQTFPITIADITNGNFDLVIDSNIVLIRSSLTDNTTTIEIEGAGNFTVQWYYDGDLITDSSVSANGRAITLTVTDDPLNVAAGNPYNIAGVHLLTVVVLVENNPNPPIPYSRRIQFKVE